MRQRIHSLAIEHEIALPFTPTNKINFPHLPQPDKLELVYL